MLKSLLILTVVALPYALCRPQGLGAGGVPNGTPPAGAGATPPGGAGATPPAGAGASPPEGAGVTPPAASGATPPAGGVTPPAGTGITPPAGTAVTPPAVSGQTPPAASGATPPSGAGVTPPAGSLTPVAASGVTPPAGAASTPLGAGQTGASSLAGASGGSTPAGSAGSTPSGTSGGPQNSPSDSAAPVPNGPFYSACQPVSGQPGVYTCKFSRTLAELGGPAPANSQDSSPSSGPAPANNASTADAGGEKVEALIICGKLNGTSPTFQFLKDASGKNVKAMGKWSKYTCSYGELAAFTVPSADYVNYANQCKALGFETPQPTDDAHQGLNPFDVDRTISEYYRQTSVDSYNKQPSAAADKC